MGDSYVGVGVGVGDLHRQGFMRQFFGFTAHLWVLGRPAGLALALLILVACSRAPDAPWVVTEEAPPLARELAPAPPPDVFWSPRTSLQEGSERTLSVRVAWDVRQRGPGVPATPLSVEEDLTLVRRVVARADRATTLRVTVPEVEVAVDPPVEALAADLRQSRLDTVLRIVLAGTGRLEKATRVPRRGGASEALDGPGRNLVGTLRRLWPVLPDRAVQVGDGWDVRETATRPLPGGGDARETLTGRYHFLGMVRTGAAAGGEAAAVSLDYDLAVSGPGRGSPRVTGTGVGRGVFLLDPDTAEVLRAQVVESAHVQVDWPSRRRPRRAEQLTRAFFEMAATGGTP